MVDNFNAYHILKYRKRTARNWNMVVSKKIDRQTYHDVISMSRGKLANTLIGTVVSEQSQPSTEDAAMRSEQE